MGPDSEDPNDGDLQYLEDEAAECLDEYDDVVVSTGLVSSGLAPPETVEAILETYAETMIRTSWTPAEEISVSTDIVETDAFEGTAFSVATALKGDPEEMWPEIDREDHPEKNPSATIVTALSRAANVYRTPDVDVPRLWDAYEQVTLGKPIETIDPVEIEKGDPEVSLTEIYEDAIDGEE